MPNVWIAGAGMTRVGRRSEPLGDLMADAAHAASGAAALYTGVAQVAASLHRTVLVVGGEKMTHLPTPRVSEIIGRSIDPYERAYGATMPALAGLVTRALMDRRGVGAREIAQVA